MFSPQGDLYLCPKLKYDTAGDLRRAPFDELWRGAAAEEIRDRIRSGACHCWLNCTSYLAIAQALERGMPTAVRSAAGRGGTIAALLAGLAGAERGPASPPASGKRHWDSP